MKQLILIIAILMLSLPVTAQLKKEKVNAAGEQVYFIADESDYKGAIESDISLVARNFNGKGIEKALTEKNFEAAAGLFQQAVESDQRCFVCKYNLGLSLMKSEKYDQAFEAFSNLTSDFPSYANGYSGLGEVYGKKGLYKDSVAAFEKAIKLESKDPILLSNLGNALFQIKDYKNSLIYLDKAIKINPSLVVAHSNRGATLYEMGRYKDAIESLKYAIALHPSSAEAQNNLGVALSRLGKFKEAHKCYLEAVRLRPQWEIALYNLAMSNFALKKRDEAQRQLAVLENLAPDLAKDLRKAFFNKYLIDVSDVK
jgi:tetratricopeptide (TPR) repeat protein